ncbi:MAG: Hsp70 family protein, partial [Anaerolineae bacterium]
STNLSDTDVDRMVREAEQNADADQKRRELIEARNTADQAIYQTEKSLAELNGQAAAVKPQVEAKIAELKEAAKGDDVARIQSLIAEVQQLAMQIGQAMYQQPDSNNSNGGSPNPDEDIVEGEFEAA